MKGEVQSEPRIIELENPIWIVGLSVDTNVRRVFRDIPALGRRFKRAKKRSPIPDLKEPWGFAAVSKGYDPKQKAWTYIMGDVVSTLDNVPEEFISFEIPAMTYAMITIRPKNRLLWSKAIVNAKQMIYGVWLPNSDYEQAGIIDDFEYHNDRSLRKKNPEIDLYVAIKKK